MLRCLRWLCYLRSLYCLHPQRYLRWALFLCCASIQAQTPLPSPIINGGGSGGSPGSGTVTSVSVVTADGVSGSVANPTTTPAITLTLGDLVATSLKLGNGPNCTPGTGQCIATSEGTAPIAGAAAAVDLCYGDSTAHGLECSFNNDAYSQLSRFSNNLGVFASTTSAQLAGVISNETGTGLLVFGTGPTITLANATGLPIAGLSGLGTGVATALAAGTSGTGAICLASGSTCNGGGGTGTVTSIATTGPITGGTITTTGTIACATCALNTTNTFSGLQTLSASGAASTSVLALTGNVFSGGSGTTTVPMILWDATGNTPETFWNTAGTFLGINLPSAFAGNIIDIKVNGGFPSLLTLTPAGILTTGNTANFGNVSVGSGGTVGWSGESLLTSSANGLIELKNAASSGFTRLNFGLVSTSFPALGVTSQTNPILRVLDANGGTTANLQIPAQKSSTGQRFICIDTSGNLVSSVTACVGT